MTAVISTDMADNGILTLTFDDPDRPINVLSREVINEFAQAVDQAVDDRAVKSILLCSGKSTFVAGADLKELLALLQDGFTLAQGHALSQRLKLVLRRLESCGKPVAAAMNGTALGGGFELALACHYRVLSDDAKTLVGLPEVTLGLLPGGGGTQRLPRLIGIVAALPLLLQGTLLNAQQALSLGIVDQIAPPSQLNALARKWLESTATTHQPWDRKTYVLPGGGVMSAPVAQTFALATAKITKVSQRNYPAPIAILSAVFEGCNVPIDVGLEIESDYFATLLTGPVPRNMIRTLFVAKGMADKLSQRPKDIATRPVRKLGVLGAGMMGSGVAYVAARAGIDVVLLDSSLDLASKGKDLCGRILGSEMKRGRLTDSAAEVIIGRISPTTQYAHLAGSDMVIEAVFEQRDLKRDVIGRGEATLAPDATFATNTSTLPISGLAASVQRPKQFIGIHFFSPVERMPLVEIIVGTETSSETVARALDFVAQLRKTPIVVRDGRGFFTSRVFGTFTAEGVALLSEGVNPALIENAALAAGMPVGPLAVSDEVSLELQYNVVLQGERDLGPLFVAPVNYALLKTFVLDLKRTGKKSGHGFYEYPATGKKFLWPGLSALIPRSIEQPSVGEVKRRLLHIQALEGARCVEEGVISRPTDADIGSVLGIGFPSYTGGVLSYIDTLGIRRFVEECNELAIRYGERYRPSPWLMERAARGQSFHGSAIAGEND